MFFKTDRRIPANRACAAPLLTSPLSPEGAGGRAAHARRAGGGGGQFNRKHPADLNGRFGRQEGPRPPSWSAEGAPRGGRDERRRRRRRRRERSGFAARPRQPAPDPGKEQPLREPRRLLGRWAASRKGSGPSAPPLRPARRPAPGGCPLPGRGTAREAVVWSR
ncbi:hypothetical protein LUU34_00728800 [Aix galericulata]|nr:hypothetical protein LUU34_00728800 [Aix galericulata]